jgi:hypothetical protein
MIQRCSVHGDAIGCRHVIEPAARNHVKGERS